MTGTIMGEGRMSSQLRRIIHKAMGYLLTSIMKYAGGSTLHVLSSGFYSNTCSSIRGRAFVIIRNPMKSIPSFFNHIYEMRNHLPVHSERAPVEEWVKWRNAYLQIEIDEYKKFIM